MGISEEDKPWQAKPRWTICLILLLTFSAPKQIHYSLKSIWKKQWKTFEFFFYIILPRRRRERSLEVLNKKDEESKREIVSCQRWNQTEFVPSQLGCDSVLWSKLLKPPPSVRMAKTVKNPESLAASRLKSSQDLPFSPLLCFLYFVSPFLDSWEVKSQVSLRKMRPQHKYIKSLQLTRIIN